MAITNFKGLLTLCRGQSRTPLAIAQPHKHHVLQAVAEAAEAQLITPHLFGNKDIIQKLAEKHNISLEGFVINNYNSEAESIEAAGEAVKNDTCKILMKGDQSTASIMSPVLKKTNNLRGGKTLSHTFILELPTYHKLLAITDCGLNIAPSLAIMKGIIENAVELARVLQINTPKVALLSAVEVPTPKMPSTLLAQQLAKDPVLNEQAILEGPMAFDAAISREAADIKGMASEIAGSIDIACVPNIESGNILAKSLIYLSKAKSAGIITGAKVPIVLTSRSDSAESKFLSIALACIYSNRNSSRK